ncbi:protein kinase domain-containing protein [Neobacillus rhizophilus]|uniref:Serine/threonine protein kinase n=1 Tax=Neobacillus rhizophilus TaxID=2833579 RepID=A0A942UCV6_9BACI|nr:serine/threonine-protein kinase [Neobacillus rhizophilus]MBS4216611.1 serine/threonine protein kinase [Neobacillus rhizophilus]MBU8919994.1 serine/threonine-protein kinase [Bacillus sp. FJAT-29953]
MMNHTWKNQYKLSPGTNVTGRWHSKQYKIIKELGFGANGVVYLAKNNNTQVALKMSDNGMSITSEVNVLKSFAKVQGQETLGPSLFDVDDWQVGRGNSRPISFYVMEYIQGPDLLSFLEQKGKSWMPILFLQLLNDLDKLHGSGWIFGDLKPENLIVTGPPPKIRCIDVGGTTIEGRAIKEFTEFYDRGYWGLGSRKAEATYDLFSAAMMMINTAYPKRFKKTTGGIEQLREAIRLKPELHRYERVILKALMGHYPSASQMRSDLLDTISDQPKKDSKPVSKGSRPSQHSTQSPKGNINISRRDFRKKKKKSGWLEFFFIAIVLSVLYGLYIFLKLL